jgi:hypothetical protein
MGSVAVFTTVAANAAALDRPVLLMDIEPAAFDPCAAIDRSMSCAEVITGGSSDTVQMVSVFLAGTYLPTGVQFGVTYDPGVTVTGWTLCSGGLQIPESGWPASGTGNAVTWPEPHFSGSPDELALVGIFTVAAGSEGEIRLSVDPRIGQAQFTSAEYEGAVSLLNGDLGKVGVDSLTAGCNPCADECGIGMGTLGFGMSGGGVSPLWTVSGGEFGAGFGDDYSARRDLLLAMKDDGSGSGLSVYTSLHPQGNAGPFGSWRTTETAAQRRSMRGWRTTTRRGQGAPGSRAVPRA